MAAPVITASTVTQTPNPALGSPGQRQGPQARAAEPGQRLLRAADLCQSHANSGEVKQDRWKTDSSTSIRSYAASGKPFRLSLFLIGGPPPKILFAAARISAAFLPPLL